MFPMNTPQNTGTGGGLPAPPSETSISYTTGASQTWSPPARWAVIDGKWVYGEHQGIVQANGTLGDYYNLNSDPEVIWYSLSATKRATIVDIFESKGVPARTVGQQLNAFGQLLQQSNALGSGWEMTLTKFQKLATGRTSTGPTYRVANPADLRAVAKAVFRETIGREANEDEAARFVASYQQAQRAGTGSVAAPSAEVAAQDFARIAAPQEAAAYDILGYIGQFVNAAQGVGR